MKFQCRLGSRGIRFKLILYTTPVILFSVTAVVWLTVHTSIENLRNTFTANLSYVVDQYCETIQMFPDLDQQKLETLLNKEINIGKSGFVFVVGYDGTMLIHRKVQGQNWAKKPYLQHILRERNGTHRYISPKTKTWKVAAFRTIESKKCIVVASAFEDEVLAGEKSHLIKAGLLIGSVSMIIAMTVLSLLAASITKPICDLVKMMTEIASGGGDLTKELRVQSKDEVSQLAMVFNQFIGMLRKMIKEISTGATHVEISAEKVDKLSIQIQSLSENTTSKTHLVSTSTEEMSSNMDSLTRTMNNTSRNLQSISNSTQQMSETINEIASSASQAMNITTEAVTDIQESSRKANQLTEAAKSVGSVTDSIAEISEQTNLLALNATIEAARAGEAGKGFAVVAREIKELSTMTSKATDEIHNRILEIQHSAKATVGDIHNVVEVIENVDQIVRTIASAVEEQSATTSQISRELDDAFTEINSVSSGVENNNQVTHTIAQGIMEVDQASEKMKTDNTLLKKHADELQLLSVNLNNLVGRFVVE